MAACLRLPSWLDILSFKRNGIDFVRSPGMPESVHLLHLGCDKNIIDRLDRSLEVHILYPNDNI